MIIGHDVTKSDWSVSLDVTDQPLPLGIGIYTCYQEYQDDCLQLCILFSKHSRGLVRQLVNFPASQFVSQFLLALVIPIFNFIYLTYLFLISSPLSLISLPSILSVRPTNLGEGFWYPRHNSNSIAKERFLINRKQRGYNRSEIYPRETNFFQILYVRMEAEISYALATARNDENSYQL